MEKAIPRQHPAVVLRSHFVLVRGLLAAITVAVVALAVAVVILASAAPVPQPQAGGATDTIRYDGGPEEGTRGPQSDVER
jgi:hypothetical protein